MLKALTILIVAQLALCLAYEIVEDTAGVEYYLVPVAEQHHHRARRQLSGIVGPNSAGVSATGTLVNNRDHQLLGTGTVTKHFGGPVSGGGSLDYQHKPSGSGLNLGATHTPGFGTNVGASGNYNFHRSADGSSTAGVNGYYNRNFGGPYGTGRPNYGAFVTYTKRF